MLKWESYLTHYSLIDYEEFIALEIGFYYSDLPKFMDAPKQLSDKVFFLQPKFFKGLFIATKDEQTIKN